MKESPSGGGSNAELQLPNHRILLAHLNPLSARLHFWVADLANGPTACLLDGVPPLSTVHQTAPPQAVHPHPSGSLAILADWLGCPQSELQIVNPELAWIEMPGDWIPVSLILLKTRELPQLLPAGRFIGLMDIMEIPQQERILFRYGYEALLGD